jgi:hypothetical protein
MLVLLAAAWIVSPVAGVGPSFLAWSVPAAATLWWSWRSLDRLGVRQVPRGPGILAAVVTLWLLAAWLAAADLGAEMALDGLILRRPTERFLGSLLEWVPGLYGLALSVAGLAAGLEARYRVAHGEAEADPDL